MKLRALFLLTVIGYYASHTAALAQQLTADQRSRINIGINLIKLGCGTGSSREKAEVSGEVEGSLSLRKIPGVSAGGKVEYSTEEAQGLASALQKELTAEGAKLSQAQLDCMKPYIEKIFAVIFPEQGQTAPVLPPSDPAPLPQSTEQEFSLTGGQSIFLTKNKVIFSAIRNPIGGRGDLFGVRLNGKDQYLAVGKSVDFPYGQGSCSITLLEIPKTNNGKFFLRC